MFFTGNKKSEFYSKFYKDLESCNNTETIIHFLDKLETSFNDTQNNWKSEEKSELAIKLMNKVKRISEGDELNRFLIYRILKFAIALKNQSKENFSKFDFKKFINDLSSKSFTIVQKQFLENYQLLIDSTITDKTAAISEIEKFTKDNSPDASLKPLALLVLGEYFQAKSSDDADKKSAIEFLSASFKCSSGKLLEKFEPIVLPSLQTYSEQESLDPKIVVLVNLERGRIYLHLANLQTDTKWKEHYYLEAGKNYRKALLEAEENYKKALDVKSIPLPNNETQDSVYSEYTNNSQCSPLDDKQLSIIKAEYGELCFKRAGYYLTQNTAELAKQYLQTAFEHNCLEAGLKLIELEIKRLQTNPDSEDKQVLLPAEQVVQGLQALGENREPLQKTIDYSAIIEKLLQLSFAEPINTEKAISALSVTQAFLNLKVNSSNQQLQNTYSKYLSNLIGNLSNEQLLEALANAEIKNAAGYTVLLRAQEQDCIYQNLIRKAEQNTELHKRIADACFSYAEKTEDKQERDKYHGFCSQNYNSAFNVGSNDISQYPIILKNLWQIVKPVFVVTANLSSEKNQEIIAASAPSDQEDTVPYVLEKEIIGASAPPLDQENTDSDASQKKNNSKNNTQIFAEETALKYINHFISYLRQATDIKEHFDTIKDITLFLMDYLTRDPSPKPELIKIYFKNNLETIFRRLVVKCLRSKDFQCLSKINSGFKKICEQPVSENGSSFISSAQRNINTILTEQMPNFLCETEAEALYLTATNPQLEISQRKNAVDELTRQSNIIIKRYDDRIEQKTVHRSLPYYIWLIKSSRQNHHQDHKLWQCLRSTFSDSQELLSNSFTLIYYTDSLGFLGNNDFTENFRPTYNHRQGSSCFYYYLAGKNDWTDQYRNIAIERLYEVSLLCKKHHENKNQEMLKLSAIADVYRLDLLYRQNKVDIDQNYFDCGQLSPEDSAIYLAHVCSVILENKNISNSRFSKDIAKSVLTSIKTFAERTISHPFTVEIKFPQLNDARKKLDQFANSSTEQAEESSQGQKFHKDESTTKTSANNTTMPVSEFIEQVGALKEEVSSLNCEIRTLNATVFSLAEELTASRKQQQAMADNFMKQLEASQNLQRDMAEELKAAREQQRDTARALIESQKQQQLITQSFMQMMAELMASNAENQRKKLEKSTKEKTSSRVSEFFPPKKQEMKKELKEEQSASEKLQPGDKQLRRTFSLT